jgi:anti-sigma factor RsiW
MSLCESIETLAMAYLDDELAVEERRELEHHLLDCAGCKQHLDGERVELAVIRKALVVPPASDLVKARVTRALDAEDRTTQQAQRKQRLSRWMLPGSAMFAAVAALAVFVSVRPAGVKTTTTIASEVVRQHSQALPLEVQGVGTAPWVRQHFAPTVTVPQFTDSVELVGARLTAVNGHDAAQLQYAFKLGTGTIPMSAVVIRDLAPESLGGGREVSVGDLVLHVIDIDGVPAGSVGFPPALRGL